MAPGAWAVEQGDPVGGVEMTDTEVAATEVEVTETEVEVTETEVEVTKVAATEAATGAAVKVAATEAATEVVVRALHTPQAPCSRFPLTQHPHQADLKVRNVRQHSSETQPMFRRPHRQQ